MENIGEKIKEYRERAGVSQKRLGLSLGLSDKAISSYESGRTIPSLDTIEKIATELGVSIDDLWSSSPRNTALNRLDIIESDLKEILEEIKQIRKRL